MCMCRGSSYIKWPFFECCCCSAPFPPPTSNVGLFWWSVAVAFHAVSAVRASKQGSIYLSSAIIPQPQAAQQELGFTILALL